MAKQLHKRFSTEEVKMFLQQYLGVDPISRTVFCHV